MKTKPAITYCRLQGNFYKDGVEITDDEAREIWDAGTGDWSMGAFEKMAQRVLSENVSR